MSFSGSVYTHTLKTQQGFDRFRRAVILSLFKSVILDTPVDTGRLRGNWQTSVGEPKTDSVDVAGKASGTVAIAAILPNLGGLWDTVYLSNNLPYAFGIEFEGKSKQKAPRGMVRRNVLRINTLIDKSAKTHLGL